MKPVTCKHCGAIEQHHSFQCHTQRKPIKKKDPTKIGNYTMKAKPQVGDIYGTEQIKSITNTVKPKAEKSTKELKELAQIVVNRFVRNKYSCTDGTTRCYTCLRWVSSKEVDASHFISVKHQATRYDLDNLRSCCIPCNRINYGELKNYRQHLVSEIGESAVEGLEMRSKEVKKWTREELLEIIDKHK